MTDNKKSFWSWALTPKADAHMLWFIVGLCVLLLLAGLVVQTPDMPFISDIPFATAVSAFAAALVAVVLAWPLQFLLRRRAGYYAGDEAGNGKDAS